MVLPDSSRSGQIQNDCLTTRPAGLSYIRPKRDEYRGPAAAASGSHRTMAGQATPTRGRYGGRSKVGRASCFAQESYAGRMS